MDHETAAADVLPNPSPRRRWRGDGGAVGTEMAIVVAIVVAISLALGVVMRDSAEAHQECIPTAPGDEVPAGCNE